MNRNLIILYFLMLTNFCAFSQAKETKLKLTGIEWHLTKLGSDTIILTYPVTLSFKPMNNKNERSFIGDSFCTYYGGDYKITASKGMLQLVDIIANDMKCDKESQQMDNLYFNKIQMVSNYILEKNLLKLYSGDNLIMVFKKK